MQQRIGIQLYTLRDVKDISMETLVKTIAEMGYSGVEFPGGMMALHEPDALAYMARDAGITLLGLVFSEDELDTQMDEIIAYCIQCGCVTVIMPGFFDIRDDSEAFTRCGEKLTQWGRALAACGIRLLYHVHGHEFTVYGGKTGMDIIMETLDLSVCGLEIDVYWVEWGKQDAVAFMQKYGRRSPYLHLKDMTDRLSFHDTEVGAGCVNMPEVVRLGMEQGTEWFIVEQEAFDRPPLESAAISLANIKAIMAGMGGDTL